MSGNHPGSRSYVLYATPALPQRPGDEREPSGFQLIRSLRALCALWQREATPPPQKETSAEEDQDRSERPEPGDDVVDRRHEVVGCGAEGGREAPAVHRGRLRRRARLEDVHRDGAVRRVVLDV